MSPLFVLAVIASLFSSAAGTAHAGTDELGRRIEVALERAGEDGELGVAEAGRMLRQLGAKALPRLFEELGAQKEQTRSPVSRALLSAFSTSPPQAVRDAASRAGASPLGLRGALVALGELGGTNDLRLVAELGSRAAERGELDDELAYTLEHSLARLLARDSRGATTCGELLRGAHPCVRERLVLAMSAEPSTRTLEGLAKGLALDPELDRLILAELGRLGLASRRIASQSVLERVRPLLAHEDPRVAAEAALALGRLGDTTAAGELVALLRRPEPEVARKAHRALIALTGLAMRPDSGRWENWYRDEERWWRDDAPRWIEQLASGEVGSASESILALGRRRLHRDEAAAEIARALAGPDPHVVELACATLGQLRSSYPLPALVDCLAHPDERVRDAAWRALCCLTGRDLPPDPVVWRSVLPG